MGRRGASLFPSPRRRERSEFHGSKLDGGRKGGITAFSLSLGSRAVLMSSGVCAGAPLDAASGFRFARIVASNEGSASSGNGARRLDERPCLRYQYHAVFCREVHTIDCHTSLGSDSGDGVQAHRGLVAMLRSHHQGCDVHEFSAAASWTDVTASETSRTEQLHHMSVAPSGRHREDARTQTAASINLCPVLQQDVSNRQVTKPRVHRYQGQHVCGVALGPRFGPQPALPPGFFRGTGLQDPPGGFIVALVAGTEQ
ncbi:hypothetical protein EYF80_045816 [Liparis tanakae]|uniref:Uncharacterized protein n=1 Tax=Liparis tanakae TaxID=230148 RepID=A0A4Z2FS62_9TELE|nr:hypothetical protein EYF80_045816 [Liparis tanakae]